MKKKSRKTDRPGNIEERPIPVSPAAFSPRSLASNPLVHVACIVLLIIIIYSNTLNAPFQWDEPDFIINNPIIKDLHYFTNPSDAKGFELYSALINRYIGYLSFALNYRMHGSTVTGYHIVNVAIHIANAVFVYLLVLLIFKTQFMASSSIKQHSRYIALFSSMLFAVHPLQTEAVTYVFQRLASLAAFFYLLSLSAYIQSRLSEGRRKRLFYYIVSFISAVLAMKTKENAFTLPVVITLCEFSFFDDSMKKKMFYLAPILLTLTIIPLTLMRLTGTHQLDPGAYGFKMFSRWDYFFTQFRVIITYLRLLFFPVNQNIDYDYPLFTSFFDLPVLLSFVFLAALFGLGIYLVRSSRFTIHYSQPLRLMGFGILWFFITLSVESGIIPIPMVINEYRMYLPSVGMIISVVTGAFLLSGKLRASRQPAVRLMKDGRIIPVIAVLSIGVLSIATYQRNNIWGDKIRLWEDTAAKSPLSALPHNNLGQSYQARSMPDKALEQYLIAIKLKPDYADAYNNLGMIYKDLNRPDKAIEQYLIAIRLSPDFALAHYNLGNSYENFNMPDKAMEQYLIAVKLKPDYPEAHNNLGNIYKSLNMFDKAISELQIAATLSPNNAYPHFNLGALYYRTGQLENARRELTAGLKIMPEDQRAEQLLKEVSR